MVRALVCAPVALLQPKRDYKQYAEGAATRVEWKLGQDLIAANPDDWEVVLHVRALGSDAADADRRVVRAAVVERVV